jgi:prolyl-tRNA editing enzyme YbaK/EbsC (Cys-tRNA(Pro) deacylase)
MLSKAIKNFLDKNKTKYETVEHRTVYTALDKAATLRVKPAIIGKTVILSLGNKNFVMGLIPANKNVDKKKVLAAFSKLRQKTEKKNYKKIDFATEKWMKANIKNAKIGATPPLADFYKLPCFTDGSLLKQSKIIVSGGDYETSLKLSPASLLKLNPATVKGSFSMAKK